MYRCEHVLHLYIYLPCCRAVVDARVYTNTHGVPCVSMSVSVCVSMSVSVCVSCVCVCVCVLCVCVCVCFVQDALDLGSAAFTSEEARRMGGSLAI